MTAIVLTSSPDPMERLATVERRKQGETIYHCNDPALHFYRIVTGGARKFVRMPDGRQQIVDFLLPGDLFGFGSYDKCHQFFTEALTPDTLVARYPRQLVEALAESNPVVARSVREHILESLARVQKQLVLLGRSSALSKVSAFLLQMAERYDIRAGNALSLPMARRDIADYLAIAIETVSRALTELRQRRAIALDGTRRVFIIDREILEGESTHVLARIDLRAVKGGFVSDHG